MASALRRHACRSVCKCGVNPGDRRRDIRRFDGMFRGSLAELVRVNFLWPRLVVSGACEAVVLVKQTGGGGDMWTRLKACSVQVVQRSSETEEEAVEKGGVVRNVSRYKVSSVRPVLEATSS